MGLGHETGHENTPCVGHLLAAMLPLTPCTSYSRDWRHDECRIRGTCAPRVPVLAMHWELDVRYPLAKVETNGQN